MENQKFSMPDVTITSTALMSEAGNYPARITVCDDQTSAGLCIFEGEAPWLAGP